MGGGYFEKSEYTKKGEKGGFRGGWGGEIGVGGRGGGGGKSEWEIGGVFLVFPTLI